MPLQQRSPTSLTKSTVRVKTLLLSVSSSPTSRRTVARLSRPVLMMVFVLTIVGISSYLWFAQEVVRDQAATILRSLLFFAKSDDESSPLLFLETSREDEDESFPLPSHLAYARRKDLKKMFRCTEYLESSNRPTQYHETWKILRELYLELQRERHPEFSSLRLSMIEQRLRREETSLEVPYFLAYTADKGLGIFAQPRIRQGTVVETGGGGRVTFANANDYRRFLNAVPSSEMACLVLQCSAVEQREIHKKKNRRKETRLVITVYLDDACFMNTGDKREPSNTIMSQLVSSSEDEGEMCRDCLVATRDIEAGEEILDHYGDYVAGSWRAFSL